MANCNPYDGPERRVHKVYVTRHTEYHVRKGVCVAVKPRQSETWIDDHGALRMRLDGLVKQGMLAPLPGPPVLGARMYFTNGEAELLTSSVVDIVRPPKNVVAQYPPEQEPKEEDPTPLPRSRAFTQRV